MHSGHVNAERIAPLECLGAEAAGVEEEAGEVDGLQVILHLGRNLGLEGAEGAAGQPRRLILHNELSQVGTCA